jgi:hypothetical protein
MTGWVIPATPSPSRIWTIQATTPTPMSPAVTASSVQYRHDGAWTGREMSRLASARVRWLTSWWSGIAMALR